jgi:hypothetical protein
VKRIKLLAAGMSASVAVAFIINSIFGFIALALLILLTFFEFERRETELKEIGDYINMEIFGYLSNHSFSIGVAFTIIGMSLLSPAFLIKDGWAYWHGWQKGISNILLALQLRLFLIAILFLAVGLILTNRNLKGSEKR